jgi:hypothetical protein
MGDTPMRKGNCAPPRDTVRIAFSIKGMQSLIDSKRRTSAPLMTSTSTEAE